MRDQVIQFLEENDIPYSERGKNISKDHVGIKCPLCLDDKSKHCNISLETGRFFCWRDKKNHRGSFRFLSLLLTGKRHEFLKPVDDVDMDKMFGDEGISQARKIPKFDFKKLSESPINVFHKYLKKRGFDDTYDLCSKYDIRYDTETRDWAWRVIFPIYQKGRLVSWVGRHVDSQAYLKYRESSKLESVVPPSDCLYNFDTLYKKGGDYLIITEGIFDALKFDYFGPENVRATCLFTKYLKSNKQLILLYELRFRFKMYCILLDDDAYFDSLSLLGDLSVIGQSFKILQLPPFLKNSKDKVDPGAMTKEQVEKFIETEVTGGC